MDHLLSDNYHLRKWYFERDQVPTQSVMKSKMGASLARVYFKSMTPNLKVIAGLEPRLKNPGNDWHVPPEDVLKGKVVLMPMKKEHMDLYNWGGICHFGQKLSKINYECNKNEIKDILFEHNTYWHEIIEEVKERQWAKCNEKEQYHNTAEIDRALVQFSQLYVRSLKNIELLFSELARCEVSRFREETYNNISNKYATLLRKQSSRLMAEYEQKLTTMKSSLKEDFKENIRIISDKTAKQIHDIYVEKYVAIGKSRKFLECQKLACQIYVALKEQERSQLQQSIRKHKKVIHTLDHEIKKKDEKIVVAEKKAVKAQNIYTIWQKKVCHIIKEFQRFVTYCLRLLPDHADFFINLEKLMLIQLCKVIDNPKVESIFELDVETIATPVPRPRPFYLFCDDGYKAHVNQALCPKHCTSSASQLPVIIVNKRCIYAACDIFEQIREKLERNVHGESSDDADFENDHDYTQDVPVKYTASKQIHELKLESSLLQVLQQEIENLKDIPFECVGCKIPQCFCSDVSSGVSNDEKLQMKLGKPSPPPLLHSCINKESECVPDFESYIKYIEPKRCKCIKTYKKHLTEHLPAYMRKESKYDEYQLPYYEKCSVTELKSLVEEARGAKRRVLSPKWPLRTNDTATQCSDPEYEYLCTCFSDDNIDTIFKHEMPCAKILRSSSTDVDYKVFGGLVSPTFFTQTSESFALSRAKSLKQLIEQSSEIEKNIYKYRL